MEQEMDGYDQEDMDDEEMDEPMDMDNQEQDDQKPEDDMEGPRNEPEDDGDVEGIDPSFKDTKLSKDEKLAITKGLGDWDSKFTEMFEKKNQDLEA